ncbi:MAG: hypothetical protein RI945_322 [Candidatus Parcubacteria bacterium]|jgi:hypothetical protein
MKKNFFAYTILVLVIIGLVCYILFYKKDKNDPLYPYTNATSTSIGTTTRGQTDNPPQIGQVKDPKTGDRVPSRYACVGEYCDGSMSGDDYLEKYTILKIPLIKEGGNIGCNVGVFFAPHAVPKTKAVLDATFRLLFDIKQLPEIKEDGFRNTVAAFSKTFFDHVTLDESGLAKIYLVGSIMSPGTCADPEFAAQIEGAAFQYETVKSIQVYLNGKLFDWCTLDVSGGEGLCKNGPLYWIISK